jgi:hypothetical protein
MKNMGLMIAGAMALVSECGGSRPLSVRHAGRSDRPGYTSARNGE